MVARRLWHRSHRKTWHSPLLVLLVVLFLGNVAAAAVPAAGAAAAASTGTAHSGGQTIGKRDSTKTGLGAPASDIITITGNNFKETMKEGTWFVKFYTDWCKICQRLQPTWEEVAKELKGKVNVGQVNCDLDPALCRRFHVAGYPTIVHVHNRRTRLYKPTMSREKNALVSFALKGYKKQVAVSILRSPFGPLENFKALIVRGAVRVKNFVVVQIETGTPMWMICLSAVAVLVVVTVIVAVVAVGVSRPKQD